jgi:phosphatidylglycerophosphate synthase
MPRVARALDHAPNALALIRPVIGVASGFAVSTDNGAIAAWLYLAGYLSDVADGFLSRAINAKSDFGAALDRLADVAFHIAVGLGLVCAAIRHETFGVLVILGILVIGERFMRRWIAARSVAGKGIGGAYRVVMFALLLVFCDPGQRPLLIEAGLTVMVITYVYEGFVTLNELRIGERPLR